MFNETGMIRLSNQTSLTLLPYNHSSAKKNYVLGYLRNAEETPIVPLLRSNEEQNLLLTSLQQPY